MFTILGGDGKEYGPASAGQIRAWIQSGRANLDTQAKAAGQTEWRRLGDFPDFNSGLPLNVPPPLQTEAAPAESFSIPAFTAATPPSAEPELAERGTRLAAVALDSLIGLVAATPGILVLGSSFLGAALAASRGQQPDFSDINPGRLLLGLSLLLLFTFSLLIVQVVMISTRGQSIGKRVLGIRIVRTADESNPGFVYGWLLRSLAPGLLGAVPMIGSVFTIVNYCFIFRADRRCLHDLIAGTKVVKV